MFPTALLVATACSWVAWRGPSRDRFRTESRGSSLISGPLAVEAKACSSDSLHGCPLSGSRLAGHGMLMARNAMHAACTERGGAGFPDRRMQPPQPLVGHLAEWVVG